MQVPQLPEGFTFPGDLTMGRAFRFAYMSGNNGFEITQRQFQASCIQYGLDSPFPLIQTGNDILFPIGCLAEQLQQQKNLSQESKNITSAISKIQLSASNVKLEEMKKEQVVKIQKPSQDNQNFQINIQGQNAQQKKQLLPSYEAIGNLFSQHFSILQEIQSHSKKLKEAFNQNNWEPNAENCMEMLKNIEELIHVLDTALYTIKLPLRIKSENS